MRIPSTRLTLLIPLLLASCGGGGSSAPDTESPDAGTFSDSGKLPVTSNPLVTCRTEAPSTGDSPEVEFCRCESAPHDGPLRYQGDDCGESAWSRLCCATENYPEAGSNCECINYHSFLSSATYACHTFGGLRVCECNLLGLPPKTTPLSQCRATDTDGGICCASSKFRTCTCFTKEGSGDGNCAADEHKVSDCSSLTSAGIAPPPKCAEGTTPVKACSKGLITAGTPASPPPGGGGAPPGCDPSTCSGSSCADGFCCFWSCNGGTCQQKCTD
jgi:hypothetical protein